MKKWLPIVTEAVAELVDRGFLEQRTGSDGSVLYRMNPARIAEFQRSLKEHDGPEGGKDER